MANNGDRKIGSFEEEIFVEKKVILFFTPFKWAWTSKFFSPQN